VSPVQSDPEVPFFQTDLSQTPLPDLLVKIHRYKAPGSIECRRGEMVKRIYLEHGSIIFATTNQVAESLGDRLLVTGRLTKSSYYESLRHVRETGKRHGVALVEMNLLSAEELFTAVREQIQAIVWSIFEWDFATVTFKPGKERHLEFVKVDVPVPRAILTGIRRVPDARALLARIGTRTTLLERSKDAIDIELLPDEQALVDAANGKTPLADLVNTAPGTPADNARLLYALHVLGILTPKSRVKVQLKSR
jgi:hypothetical protein